MRMVIVLNLNVFHRFEKRNLFIYQVKLVYTTNRYESDYIGLPIGEAGGFWVNAKEC